MVQSIIMSKQPILIAPPDRVAVSFPLPVAMQAILYFQSLYRIPSALLRVSAWVLGLRYKVRGLENVDNTRGAVVLINHQSGLDLYGILTSFIAIFHPQKIGDCLYRSWRGRCRLGSSALQNVNGSIYLVVQFVGEISPFVCLRIAQRCEPWILVRMVMGSIPAWNATC